jgi:hypothetical protein
LSKKNRNEPQRAKTMSSAHWRIRPDAYVQHHVQDIARHEGRSLSNALHKLLIEAIEHRRQPQGQTMPISRKNQSLVAVLAEAWQCTPEQVIDRLITEAWATRMQTVIAHRDPAEHAAHLERQARLAADRARREAAPATT